MDKAPYDIAANYTGSSAAMSRDQIGYVLQLCIIEFIIGSSLTSTNIKKICNEHLDGRFDVDVFDFSLDSSMAIEDQILALLTLIRKLQLPHRHVIGDLAHTRRSLAGRELKEAGRSSSDMRPDLQCS